MNELYIAIFLVGVAILCIMWIMYRKNMKPTVEHTNNNPESRYELAHDIIKHDWDNATDLIATIYFKHSIGGDKLQSILFSDTYHSKINIHGMSESKEHCKLNAVQEYHGLYFSIPLASRYHSLTGMEFSHFVQYIQRVAIYFDGDLDIPSMPDTLNKAQNLKILAIDASQYLQFKILLQGATNTANLIDYFHSDEKLKFIASNECMYVENEQSIFTIEWPQQEFTQVLYFYYTPAVVPKDMNGINIMSKYLEDLLEKWPAIVCTPDNHVLNYEMYEQINKNIQSLYAILEQNNLTPGSTIIKKLLSYGQNK